VNETGDGSGFPAKYAFKVDSIIAVAVVRASVMYLQPAGNSISLKTT
jgi:hypothetical protein